jgi:hypothetical protein
MLVHTNEFNAQHQQRITWPAHSVVARAYLDQLARSKGILPARAQAVKSALERADKIRSSRDKEATAVAEALNSLAAALDTDAGSASPADASRLRSLAGTVRGRMTSQ